jgi:predicted ATPase
VSRFAAILQCGREAIMIHRARVRNLKSIVDVAVDLSEVTVLVGRSGTGKSNFIQSLRLLRDI